MATSPYSGANTRRNAIALLLGKIPSALLAIAVLGITARIVNATEFGRYVVTMATLEIVLGFSAFGLDWILLRYVPEYRVNNSRRGLIRLVGVVVLGRGVVLLLLAFTLLEFRESLATFGIIAVTGVAFPLSMLIVIEGVMRLFRDNMLESLAMQSYLQFVFISKGMCLVAALLLLSTANDAAVSDLLFVELVASALSLVLAAGFVARGLRKIHNDTPAHWRSPSVRRICKTALSNYGSGLVEYLYSPAFLLVLLARTQVAEVVAGVGFVIRLVEIVRNYLPSMLIYAVLRARMIGVFAENKDYSDLRTWAVFLFKISVLTLLPMCGVAIVYGDTLLLVASGGLYSQYHSLLVVLCFWLAFQLHRMILGVVFNAVDLMASWAFVSFISMLVLPLILVFGYERLGVWFVAVALFSNEIVVNVLAVFMLRRRELAWGSCGVWMLKALISLGIGCGTVLAFDRATTTGMALGVVSLIVMYTFAAFALGAVDREDLRMINRGMGREVFTSI